MTERPGLFDTPFQDETRPRVPTRPRKVRGAEANLVSLRRRIRRSYGTRSPQAPDPGSGLCRNPPRFHSLDRSVQTGGAVCGLPAHDPGDSRRGAGLPARGLPQGQDAPLPRLEEIHGIFPPDLLLRPRPAPDRVEQRGLDRPGPGLVPVHPDLVGGSRGRLDLLPDRPPGGPGSRWGHRPRRGRRPGLEETPGPGTEAPADSRRSSWTGWTR